VTDPIARLTALLAKLPGVGEKTAQRLAFHVLKAPPEYARDLAQALHAHALHVGIPERGVERDERQLFGLQPVVGRDGADGAGADTCAAVNARRRVDVEHLGGGEARLVR